MTVIIRNASPEDMDQIMAVEESWPEMARAPRDKFEARLEKYPQGFFFAVLSEQIMPHIQEEGR